MEVIALTSTEGTYALSAINFDYLLYNQIDDLDTSKYDIILIFDVDGTCTLDIIQELLNSNVPVYYFFVVSNPLIIHEMVNARNYNISPIAANPQVEQIVELLDKEFTLGDAKKYTDTKIQVRGLSDIIGLVSRFLKAVSNADKETIETLYNTNLADMLQLEDIANSTLLEDSKVKAELAQQQDSFRLLENKYQTLIQTHDSLIDAGRQTEEQNIQLMTTIQELKDTLTQKEKSLLTSSEQIAELSKEIQDNKHNLNLVNQQLQNTEAERDKLQRTLTNTMKELDTVTKALNTSSHNLDNLQVSLTSTGQVEKILYIKAMDIVPYLVYAFDKYPRYVEGTLHIKGCSVFIIAPKDSYLYVEYVQKYQAMPEVTDSLPKGTYVLNGFTETIEQHIQTLQSQGLIIIDLTFKNHTLTTSIRQADYFVVNSAKTIDTNKLNPAKCIAYNNLAEVGVTAHIPHYIEDVPVAVLLKDLRLSLFSTLDSVWR